MKAPPSTLLALVRITPPPTSTIYTSALLTKLQTFGSVLEFRPVSTPGQHPHHSSSPAAAAASSRTHYAVRFSTSTALERALAASPLSISVPSSPCSSSDSPPPSERQHQQPRTPPPPSASSDPYDVLQRAHRPQPRPGVFSCSVSPLAEPHVQQSEIPPQRQRLVRHRGTAALHDALVESGAPPILARSLSLRPGDEDEVDPEPRIAGSSRQQQEQRQTTEVLEPERKVGAVPMRLMDVYRAAVGCGNSGAG